MYDFNGLREAFLIRHILLLFSETQKLIKYLSTTDYLIDKTYYHPLGFIYSKLYIFENGETIRIHIWDKEYYDVQPLMDIHSHFYIVNSFLYQGCLINNVFELCEAKGNVYSVYKGGYINEDRVLLKTADTIFLSKVLSDIHCQNDLYRIPLNTIHSGHPVDHNPVCTIVFTESPGNPSPLVVGPIDGQSHYFHPTMLVEREIVKRVIERLVST